MRLRLRLVFALFPLLVATLVAQSPRELFERARMLEESNRNLTEAITLYEQVVAQSQERPLAATAQLRVGLLHERLGQQAEAQRAFRTVAERYGDQSEVAGHARAKLDPATSPPDVGPRARQVWTGPNVGPLGAPSPDGKSLSFVDFESGNLAVREVLTGHARLLTTDGGYTDPNVRWAEFSVFSPDSRQLAYGWFTTTGYELRIVGVVGSRPQTLHRGSETALIRPFGWSPDGRHVLATLSDNDGSTRIAFVTVATGAVRTLKTLDWRAPVRASLSPDGAWIAYDFSPMEDRPARDIYLLAADGGREVKLITHTANDLSPMWTPDGEHVVFLTDRGGAMAAWIQRVTDGRPVGSSRLLKSDMTRTFPLGFTAHGSLYYVIQSGQEDIYVAAIDADTGRLIEGPARVSEHLVGANSSPDWSPDGSRLAYVSKRLPRPMAQMLGGRVLCILDVASGEVRELSPALAYLDRPRWSPDGRAILLTARVKGRSGLYRLDADTGEFSRVLQLDPPGYFNSTAWSRDGKSLFYIAGGTGDGHRVVHLDLASAIERVIDGSAGSKSDLGLSHDGRWLAYRASKRDRGGQSTATVRVVAGEGGAPRDLLPDGVPIAPFRGLNWTLDDRYVLFAVNAKDTAFRLSRVSASGGLPEPVAPELTLRRLLDVRLHRDGRRLAFTSGEGDDQIWAMENFLPGVASTGAGTRR